MKPLHRSLLRLGLLAFLAGAGAVHAAPPTNYTWTQTFSDDFNGTALDTSKWQTTWYGRHDFPTTGNKTYYGTENLEVSGGTLKIYAKNNGRAHPDYNNAWAPWTSAQLHSYDKFSQKNGYFEIRFRADKSGKGVWPAFWLSPPAGADNWPPEIDWFEIFGDNQTLWFTHWWKGPNGEALHSPTSRAHNASAWTVIGGHWDYDAGILAWYVDGVKVRELPASEKSRIPNVSMFLSIITQVGSLPVGGQWGGDPDSSVPFPLKYEIDYVKVWAKSGSSTPPPSGSPDLIVTDITAAANNRYNIVVKNQGGAATGSKWIGVQLNRNGN